MERKKMHFKYVRFLRCPGDIPEMTGGFSS